MTIKPNQDYQALLRDIVLTDATFIQLTLKGKIRLGVSSPWRQVTVRPVELKGGYHLQFSYLDAKQDTTKNFAGDDAVDRLDEVLAIPYSAIRILTTTQDIQVQLTKKGKAIIHRNKPPADIQVDLGHDSSKDLPIPEHHPDAYLQAVGIMNSQGEVRPRMRDKFKQINEFLKLLEHTNALDEISTRPLQIVDFGCGSAYLTLATYHYLNTIRGIPARLDGVDTNHTLIQQAQDISLGLDYTDACFYDQPIGDYQPDTPPDIVMALHACDTATDDALAQGIRHNAHLILSAPCCHHHLHTQLGSVDPLRPILRHGILKKRMGDILTDSFRALILRICGYKTDVVEFISSEHTDRNLMIRAVRRDNIEIAPFVAEYNALKTFWNVTPYLETLLGNTFISLTMP